MPITPRVRVKVLPDLPKHDPDPKAKDAKRVRDISVEIYKLRLGPDAVARMLAEDDDGGKKLRGRAASYDALTRDYMTILKIK